MSESVSSPKVDIFLRRTTEWFKEFVALRKIALACPVAEEIKWGWPCYSFQKKNIVLIHGFKEYCAFLFFKGVLLKDPAKLLIQQTENVQAPRQIRFISVSEINKLAPTLKSYINEAIELEKAGAKPKLKKTTDFKMPQEFQAKLDEQPALKTAFRALTPGRQRGYLFYFNSAKQSKTRESRVEKSIPQILQGKGLDD